MRKDKSNRKSTSVNIEEEHLNWMDSQDKNRSDFINMVINRYRNGQGQITDAVRQQRISQIRAEKEAKKAAVDAMDRELEQLLEYEKEAEKREDEYEADVKALAEDFATGYSIFPTYRADVRNISDDYEKDMAVVVEDVKEHVEENYDVDEDRWTDTMGEGIL